jgi:hypothetical protein
VIVPPASWSARRDGETVIFTAPGAAPANVILYDERLRPLDSVVELIKAAPPPAGFVPVRVGPIQEVVTREGEYGALVFIEGRMHDSFADLAFGFVILDDFYSRVRGIAIAPAIQPQFRSTIAELVIGDAHILGRARRRRFRYEPPAGWTEQRSLFESRWLAPDYPRDPRTIVVGPALPKVSGLADAILTGVLAGADPAQVLRGPYRPLLISDQLHGKQWQLRSRNVDTDVVILEDDSFVYCVRLDTSAPSANDEILDALVMSIRPIPPAATPSSSNPFAHWMD